MRTMITPPKPTPPSSISEALNQHLSANSHDGIPGVACYVERGAALVTQEAITTLIHLRTPLRRKIEDVKDSDLLRERLKLLTLFFDEAVVKGPLGAAAHREVTFALLYFLKGFDRIPDNVPEVGLLDDAMIVQVVLQQHAGTLRAHWQLHGRAWPGGEF